MRTQYKKKIGEEKEAFDRLDLVNSIAKVKSSIRESITEDFTLARLNDKDKKLSIETVHLAYYIRKLIEGTAVEATEWHWEENKWVERYLPEEKKEILITRAKRIFDAFMVRPYMITTVNRNVKDNYLAQWMLGIGQQEEEPKEEGIIEKTKIIREEGKEK